MNKTSLLRSKKLWIIAAISLLTVIYFFDNIKGQYRFMQYCKNEGGLRIYESVQQDAGWMVENYYDAKSLLILKHIGFIRVHDERRKEEYDLIYSDGKSNQLESYIKSDADESRHVNYLWIAENEYLANETRLQRTNFEIIDINTRKTLASFRWFTYSQFDQGKSFFSAPSFVSCFKGNNLLQDINNVFKD